MLFAALLPAFACNDAPRPLLARNLRGFIVERIPPFVERRPEHERRFREAGVYLDGKPLGVLKHSELPPSLAPVKKLLADGRYADRYRVADYLRALGVPYERLRAAHFLGGRGRAAIIEGDELRKHQSTFVFSFTRGDSGKPRMHLPPEGIRLNSTVDIISGLTLYLDKEPPAYDRKELAFHFGDGKPIEGIPYATTDLKGTRLYLDGALVGALKRKTLPDRLLVPGSDPRAPRFSLVGWLEQMGIEPARARGIELIADEDIVTRLEGAAWERVRGEIAFSIPRHSQGQMLVHLAPGDPAVLALGAAAETPRIRISAIAVYQKSPLSRSTLRPLAEILAEMGESEANGRDGAGSARPMQNPAPSPDNDEP